MRKHWLIISLVCGSLLLHACGTVTPVATHLLVTLTGGTATAGSAVSINVSAVDANGNVITSYSGTVQFTSSDAKAVFPAGGALTNGTGTFSVTLKTSGSQTITVFSGTLTGTSSAITVSPAALAGLSITASSSSPTAGTSFNIVVSAVDANNNVAPSYTGTVHFTSSDIQANLPKDAQLTNGTGNFSVTLKTAGSQTITATDTVTVSLTFTLSSITVSPGPATTLSVQAASAETTGIAFMATIRAEDAYGNVATGYMGTVHLTSSDMQATLPANSALTNGTGPFSVTLKTLGSQTITATDTVTASLKGTSSPINVVSNAATHLSVGGPGNIDTRKTFQLTVTALDAANNTSAVYTGEVHFTSSDSQAKLPADSTLTAGVATFSATLETVGSGTQTITGTDKATNSITGGVTIGVTAAPALTVSSSAPPAGTVGDTYNPHSVLVCYYNPFTHQRICHWVKENGFTLTGMGGVPPYSWSWAPGAGSSLPPGLSVVSPGNANCPFLGNNTSNRQPCIAGTPTQPGTYNVVVTVTDSGLPAVQTTANYTITINNPPPPVVHTTPAPPPGVENQPYTYTFTASGYGALTWSESGALPAGLAFNNGTATLSGTPTQTGSFPITVTATDQFKQSSAATAFTIVVTAHGFVATGSMGTARRFQTATLLGNGKVLVAGGEDAGATAFASAELYDPSTGKFTPTTGSMTAPRVVHTATLLSSGKVLITGGATDATENALSSAEVYDPATDTFTATTHSMTTARVSHTATLLKDGRVLIAGGDGIFFNGVQNTSILSLASAEIFDPGTDPATGTFTATVSMSTARESHKATLLGDGTGRVLIAGGSDGAVGNTTPAATIYATTELFDPSKGTFTAAGMMSAERDFFTATLLSTGKVLAAGGAGSTGNTADLFDPASTGFAATGNLTAPRYYHDATTLSDGTSVLLTGGSDANDRALATAEVYTPSAGTFATTGSMISVRVWHTATLLPNGKVLVTGGADNNSQPLATAELYQ